MASHGAPMEREARFWLSSLLEIELDPDLSLQLLLKDGTTLCDLANRVQPGCCPQPFHGAAPFKQMENVSAYLAAAASLGVPAHDMFRTVDLYEGKDMKAVLINIHSLGRAAQRLEGFDGPVLGAQARARGRGRGARRRS